MPLVGIGQLARELLTDPKAIRRAVQQGLMTRRSDQLFDLELAMREWRDNIRHELGHNNRTAGVVEIRHRQFDEDVASGKEAEIPDKPTKSTDYAKARTADQIYSARMKKLRYEQAAKKLAPVCDIEAASFKEMRIIRDACLNIPARIAAQLAAETSEHRVYQLLEDEIILAFQKYTDGELPPKQEAAS